MTGDTKEPSEHSRFPPQVRVQFLGTGSMVCSETRHVSSLGLGIGKIWWIFDCGEGTQMQLSKSIIHSTNITRIFITHMHGDHVFGNV